MDYFYDMIFTQVYAEFNRETMVETILSVLGVKKKDIVETVHSIHNYIDFDDLIIRKGAIRSYVGEKMLVPFNMRDGILLCEGKSNSEWNFSSPHGSGRVMSRGEANKKISLEKYQESMKGVFSTSINKSTIDESPYCYKSSEMIERLIEPTATVIDKIKPIINIKASESMMSWKERRELEKAGKQVNVNVHRSDKEKDIRKSKKELRKIKNGEYFESMGEPYEDLD